MSFYRFGLFEQHQQQQQQQQPNSRPHGKDDSIDGNNGWKSSSGTSINEYVQQAIKVRSQLALLYWNSSGSLALPPLIEQCQFRNYTEAGLWPFYLQNLLITPGEQKLALYPTSDLNNYDHYNWSVPSPIPLIAHSLPMEIVNHLGDKYHWIFFFPTPYELRGDGKRHVDRIVGKTGPPFDVPFEKRKSQIIYRGNHNSQKYVLKHQRSKIMSMGENPNNQKWLNATKTWPSRGLSQADQLWHKYLLDIGGISGTTWTGLRWKLCSNSLVFKVDSGYADWWHFLLKPYEHYVPVKRDLSDLKAQFDWAEEHPEQVKKITQKALQVCLQTTDRKYMRHYTRKQIESMPSPTQDQMGQYYNLLEDSRRRLELGQPAALFDKDKRFTREKHQCPPKLTPENM
ncbi:KDEL motif-containing protein 1 [Seminavis robusta]|uniref:KDEL motif-containing protein 1 n=1 Tax=Seminavis robusta TaxID=568900 RepID=A0A9N8DVF3_9STRA|nr:KDEL motif-containing protein 1 [Seminavis robusta]|eukprot:Sro373_g129000.1 KDEL motif-containing protein 1 (399) ;mRNA; r:23786-24982